MKLKKILLASAIVASLAGIMATGAFAAEAKMTATWDADSKSVIIENCPTAAARKTLLVLTTNTDGSLLTTVAEENIKQIDEQADAYTKVPIGDIADGKYEVRVGGDGTIASATFKVASKTDPENPYKDCTRLLGKIDDSDPLINNFDVIAAADHVVENEILEGEYLEAADADDNGVVDNFDVIAIADYVVENDTETLGEKTVAQKTNYVYNHVDE